jgi:prepilin-type N-terminal cleavage/methylation domain-containing protein
MNKGFSVIEISIGLLLLGILSLAVFKVADLGAKDQSRSNATFQADMIRRNLLTSVQNDDIWAKTVADTVNSSMACLRDVTDCSGRGGAFRLVNPAGSVIYDGNNPAVGFQTDGQPCVGFDSARGNDRCPIRMELKWEPICASGCVKPSQIKVIGKMIYKPASSAKATTINPSSYGFEVVKNFAASVVCPPGQVPHPDDPSRCGALHNVYAGSQIQGCGGMNIGGLRRCYSDPNPPNQYPNTCYSSLVFLGKCITGYNCPTDGYPYAMASGDCNGKRWDPASPGNRCIPASSSALYANACL